MTDFFDKIKYQLDKKLPFAVYSKPVSDIVTGVFQKTGAVHNLTDFNARGFVFAPFAGNDVVFIPKDDAEVITVKNEASIEAVLNDLEQPKIDETAKQEFESLVKKCVSVIKGRQFEKLVASRTEKVPVTTDVITIYKRLLQTYPNAFRYCFYTPKTGLWMGATPEQLLKAHENTIKTVALAGTQVYSETKEAVWEEKEQQEQKFVTDYILQRLSQYSSDIQATQPYTFRAGNIVHIKTDITADLKESSNIGEVINSLHPTPAVCGIPKEQAKQFLLDNEGYNRKYYSGYLGELNYDFGSGTSSKTDLFVNLRSMKMSEDNAQLFIGCGITKDSNPEKEFFETVNKSITMRKVLV
ncbi:hypothetical protein GCM10007424_11680 [Flavobacterium suaedae]|uniref:isochorismate synthase n=1 Tax=Flavobacterium suaedae TaxID=1767027 RepID=A0ABQ1JPB9_9FLAO|nr:isochorismate synthase [Flavobacterium suaedae]GGB73435.1 hypothetical protein GCM10007424_11680 [Flavobacterium suaedae]